MTEPNPRLPASRRLLERVFRAEVTQDSHPELFDEDLVLFAARDVEKYDPEWLLERIADPTLPMDGRREVVGCLGKLFNKGLALLRKEDPNAAPWLDYR